VENGRRRKKVWKFESKRIRTYFGVTEPISWAKPTKEDYEKTEKIIKILTDLNLFPPREEQMKREQVLSTIYEIIRNWCKETGFYLFLKPKRNETRFK
jgi:poly(A) polymerase Pap1